MGPRRPGKTDKVTYAMSEFRVQQSVLFASRTLTPPPEMPHVVKVCDYNGSKEWIPAKGKEAPGTASYPELKDQVMIYPTIPLRADEKPPKRWNGGLGTKGLDRVLRIKASEGRKWKIVTCIRHGLTPKGDPCWVQGTRGAKTGKKRKREREKEKRSGRRAAKAGRDREHILYAVHRARSWQPSCLVRS